MCLYLHGHGKTVICANIEEMKASRNYAVSYILARGQHGTENKPNDVTSCTAPCSEKSLSKNFVNVYAMTECNRVIMHNLHRKQ